MEAIGKLYLYVVVPATSGIEDVGCGGSWSATCCRDNYRYRHQRQYCSSLGSTANQVQFSPPSASLAINLLPLRELKWELQLHPFFCLIIPKERQMFLACVNNHATKFSHSSISQHIIFCIRVHVISSTIQLFVELYVLFGSVNTKTSSSGFSPDFANNVQAF